MALAAHLKKSGKMKVPEWVDIVKTNVGKELVSEKHFYFHDSIIIVFLYSRLPLIQIGSMLDALPSPDTSTSGGESENI